MEGSLEQFVLVRITAVTSICATGCIVGLLVNRIDPVLNKGCTAIVRHDWNFSLSFKLMFFSLQHSLLLLHALCSMTVPPLAFKSDWPDQLSLFFQYANARGLEVQTPGT